MKKNYLNLNYLYKGRWISYWYQLKEIFSLHEVKTILEIGPGNKIVSDTLVKMGYPVKTMDTDASLSPTFLADITNPASLPQETFDLILCSQVLEHFPYADFPKALRNLYRLTKKYLLLTLPYTSRGTIRFYFPFLKSRLGIKLFTPFPQKHSGGNHCWEIGKKGYRLKRILKDIRQNYFQIWKKYPLPENPYHYLLVCKKQNGFLS